jgi:hypothetical protein
MSRSFAVYIILTYLACRSASASAATGSLLAALLVEATAPPVCGSPVNWIQKKQGGFQISLS